MTATEEMRLLCLREREDEARKQGYQLIAGIDEAGRGPLAGPVVSAACILPEGFILNGVNDSKKLTPGLRDSLYLQLVENPTIHFAIGIADHDLIDEINIYQATIHSMQQAIDKLPVVPDFLLVDGLKLPSDSIPNEKVIKGDATVLAIAAASILAKVTRDRLMQGYHEKWPEYGFDRHKGYPTAMHLAALEKHGPCPIHRRTFAPVKMLK